MSKPWGGIGAWAAEAEREEAEEKAQQMNAAKSQIAEPQSFPSLKEAATAKPKKKKTTMTLSEFTVGTYVGPGGARRDLSSESKGLTTAEMLRLPTGPKERSAEEMENGRLGGGFRSYGTSGGSGRMRERNDSGDGSWGGGAGGGGRRSYGGFDDERRTPTSRVSDYDQPSRADEVDNWAMGKKSLPSMDSGRQNRYDSLGSGGSGGSRADEIDNWAAGKKSVPVRSSSNFGSGFNDSTQERPRLVLNPPRSDLVQGEPVKSSRPSPFGAARPREEILAEKGLDWRKQDIEIESKKTSRPTSSHSSRPTSSHSNRPESPAPQIAEVVQKPRPKVNPFGDAKPREVLLEAQGKDWRKIDLELEHRRVDRPETEEEKLLKEEIDNLKKELEKEATSNANGESIQGPAGEQANLNELILSREKELDLLIRELDDKVRFGQKNSERPGSGAGRFGSFPTRSPSQTELVEEPRNMEFTDRPRSRGADAWSRTGDDRRAFQGGRERGFLANNDRDRSKSGARW